MVPKGDLMLRRRALARRLERWSHRTV